MNLPFPDIEVIFEITDFKIDITNITQERIETFGGLRDVSNYEYEIKKNNEKRQISILKKEYLGVIIDDLKNIMKYDESSQFIDEKTKRV